jgi:hypothetical protein
MQFISKTIRCNLRQILACWMCSLLSVGLAQDGFHAGLLFDQFSLTLGPGQRTEAAGPFFYSEQKNTEFTWALPPFFSHDVDPALESREDDILYPLLTYDRYGKEYRWQLIQLLSFSGGEVPDDSGKKRFTIFPFYFQQRSPVTNENYTALFPIYGHINGRLFRDKIFFALFPIYGQSQRRDIVTDNYLYPIFHLRHGDGLHGWQFWPLVGSEHKDVTTQTNGFGDVSSVPGHDSFFALWPIYYTTAAGTGTDDPEKSWGALPLYAQLRSPQRDSTSVLWPFFTWIDERGKKYREWEGPWPFVIFTRGEGKTTSRVWPLFSQSRNKTMESDSYLWPFYRYHRFHGDLLDQQKTRVMFYLYEDTVEKNVETGAQKRRVDMWPFFTWNRDFDGNERLQILALLEPVVPDNRGVERNWSSLWSLWRAECNPKTGASSRSLLWNLYRSDTTPSLKKCSLLFGLIQYQVDGANKKWRLFYIPLSKTHEPTK